jgi:RNA polymerase sigma-70 factor (ECF subfamily)
MESSRGGVGDSDERAAFRRLVSELRPKLHRYCAHMTGSVIDGEDVVQETIAKALEASPKATSVANAEGWLFRIAHNAALDFLRRRSRRDAIYSDADPDMVADPASSQEGRQIVAASLHAFMRLSAAQRSSVILMDVLGYSLNEIAGVLGATIPAVKAALHRGRLRLREIAAEPDDWSPPALAEPERSLLASYVDRFNARDFDAIRNMLSEEVRLELVAKIRLHGRRGVSTYFHNYASVDDWHLVLGFVDRRPAILVRDPHHPESRPIYFVLLEWADGQLVGIRDFRHARYVAECGELITLPQ